MHLDLFLSSMNHKNPTKSTALKNLGDILARVKPDKPGKNTKPTEQTTETKYKGCRIVDNIEAGSFQIFLNDFPSQPVRTYLKRHGFDWSVINQCWSCKRSEQARYHAEKAIDKMTNG